MNNLRASIDVLFRKISPDKALGGFFRGISKGHFYELAWKSTSESNKIFHHLPYYSHDEIGNVWKKIAQDWAVDPTNRKASVFSLLYKFTKSVLIQNGNSLSVQFEHLLRWRELSHLIGEDMMTTCFLAQRDKVSGHQRSFFAWSPVLSTNNSRLKELLNKGTAENHFHLGGSAPHSDISWIALMNNITNRKKQFREFLKDGKLEPNSQYFEGDEQTELYILTIKACYIRILLYSKLHNLNEHSEPLSIFSEYTIQSVLKPTSNGKYSLELITLLPKLQCYINNYRHLFGKTIDPSVSFGNPDYCIPKNIDADNINGNILLCGERIFLYSCFKAFFNDNLNFKLYADLFYAYLIIKSQFREEMIQINKNVGFANFSIYQDRKGIFIENSGSIYQRAILNMAVNASMKNQKILSLEARFKPKSTKINNISLIKRLDEAIKSKCFSKKNFNPVDEFISSENKKNKKEKFFYVTHFIKKVDTTKGGGGTLDEVYSQTCRDSISRKSTMQEAKVLVELRSSLSIQANRIKGIDAASSELDCRPEAFAQAFRFVKFHRLDGKYDNIRECKKIPVLKATFHAGEDFYDIVDGLRSIDETVKFLNLDDGDRIGHALALGINVKDYYESKHRDLMLPKQWHLDNIVWLISRINKYNLYSFSSYSNFLKSQFNNLFNEIYGHRKDVNHVSHDYYYESWKLRGDDPYLYVTGEFKQYNNINFWERCAINERYPRKRPINTDDIINRLYYYYHFDSGVKLKGREIKRFKVETEYIKLVTEVQKEFQKEIASLHLGIETNPSSNYLIGTFKRYDKHPIINFFNLGLEIDPIKIKECPQLFVSINTDDQGVFNTYLENEYALMALALDKMEDDEGNKKYHTAMIYDWLDRIRQMGLEMSFENFKK